MLFFILGNLFKLGKEEKLFFSGQEMKRPPFHTDLPQKRKASL